MTPPPVSIQKAINEFLGNLSGNTQAAYKDDFYNKRAGFLLIMAENGIPPSAPILSLTERHGLQWIQAQWKINSPATIARRVSAFKNLLRFCELAYGLNCSAERFAQMLKAGKVNPKPKSRRRVPMAKIEIMLEYAMKAPMPAKMDEAEALRELRNRAFVICLADTGARDGEACALKYADINWKEGSAVIIGKGSKEAKIRFSDRALDHLKLYVSKMQSNQGGSTPLFGRATKKKILPIGVQTGRDIVQGIAAQALGADYIEGEITPHSLRHYFVMIILRRTGGDIKKAKELARHESINTTEKYTQLEDLELDSAYEKIFN